MDIINKNTVLRVDENVKALVRELSTVVNALINSLIFIDTINIIIIRYCALWNL